MRLGCTISDSGTSFSVYSSVAQLVELCLYKRSEEQWVEMLRLPMECGEGWVWEKSIPNLEPGWSYAYRVHGAFEPQEGILCNPNKILLDPYAKAIARSPSWHPSLLTFSNGQMSVEDSGDFGPLGAAIGGVPFDWRGDRPLRTPWEQTIIYEAHVKGMTKLCPRVPEGLRGTYLGVASEPVIEHLKGLGITAIELLPVYEHFDEYHLFSRGLTNYWGYNPLNFFSPSSRYRKSSDAVDGINEFREMVYRFHRAGIEVLLDVVYNHTCEGNEAGSTLSFRGLDNGHYYRLIPEDKRRFEDFSGCGNTFDVRNPMSLKLVLDSLRYWVEEMHVDGFRFDLASALIHTENGADVLSPFLLALGQDPLLSQVKLIAEPWDCSFGGYMVGRFPAPWRDWNGQFRDTARCFCRGDEGKIGDLASRLSGSADFFLESGRNATASINFVTSHDGFTLEDLVSYAEKHNEANLEDNRDGESNNYSFNCGTEGPTKEVEILDERELRKRNLLTILFCSKGVPMLAAGDEFCRTQRGNNNAYCQDNEMSWLSWNLNEREKQFLQFVSHLISIRSNEELLGGLHFFTGKDMPRSGEKDVRWLGPNGRELENSDWITSSNRSFGAWIVSPEDGTNGLLILFNTADKGLDFTIPTTSIWEILLDSSQEPHISGASREVHKASYYPLARQSVVILKQVNP